MRSSVYLGKYAAICKSYSLWAMSLPCKDYSKVSCKFLQTGSLLVLGGVFGSIQRRTNMILENPNSYSPRVTTYSDCPVDFYGLWTEVVFSRNEDDSVCINQMHYFNNNSFSVQLLSFSLSMFEVITFPSETDSVLDWKLIFAGMCGQSWVGRKGWKESNLSGV